MADETGKMAASPLHDAGAEEEESKSSSATFVTPALEDEGESEKTAVESKESGSAMVPAGETQVPAPVDEALALEVAETNYDYKAFKTLGGNTNTQCKCYAKRGSTYR